VKLQRKKVYQKIAQYARGFAFGNENRFCIFSKNSSITKDLVVNEEHFTRNKNHFLTITKISIKITYMHFGFKCKA